MTETAGTNRYTSPTRPGWLLAALAGLAVGVVGFCAGMVVLNGRQVIRIGTPTDSDIVLGLSLVAASGAVGGWGVRVLSGWALCSVFGSTGRWLPVLFGVGCWLLALAAAVIDLLRSNP